MKRKLDDRDVPQEVEAQQPSTSARSVATFESLGLDPRLLQAVVQQKFSAPTPVQARAIPLALSGKDILANARTGSGKTAAYVLPILQTILQRKPTSGADKCISALILVPTRELASQVTKAVKSFSVYCTQDVRVENLTRKEDDKVQRARLDDVPDILVATPSRANTLVNASVLNLEKLAYLVIDEADLVLSYGHDEDLQSLAKSIPRGVQTILMSATLRAEVQTLNNLFCQDPVLLEFDVAEKEDSKLNQYVVKCGEDEKFLLIYAIFMLKLIKGKCIIFVSEIDRCYRLKLFLEQFGIKSCVLNSELPVNSRVHVVEEFNRNVYDIIIASDEMDVVGSEERSNKRRKVAAANDVEQTQEAEDQEMDAENVAGKSAEAGNTLNGKRESKDAKSSKKAKQSREYGVSRGIDFKNVACVLNFDLPTTSKSYTHRIGRTARAGKTGMALSFVVPRKLYRKHKPTSVSTAEHDEQILERIQRHQEKKEQQVLPYDFDMKRLEGFRYRMVDALRSVTRIAVREARTRELRQELLKSEKLKRHFEENPEDLQHLRHDQESHAVRTQPHLRHVPEYLLPGGKQNLVSGHTPSVGFQKIGENRIRKARMQNRLKGKGKKPGGRKPDPLKSLGARRR